MVQEAARGRQSDGRMRERAGSWLKTQKEETDKKDEGVWAAQCEKKQSQKQCVAAIEPPGVIGHAYSTRGVQPTIGQIHIYKKMPMLLELLSGSALRSSSQTYVTGAV